MPVTFKSDSMTLGQMFRGGFFGIHYCSKVVATLTEFNISEDQYGDGVPGGVKPVCLRVKVRRVTGLSSLTVTTCSTP